MSFDWTNPAKWTFKAGECVEFAEAVLSYVSNCTEKYPSAHQRLAKLQQRAEMLQTVNEMSDSEFDRFRSQVLKERDLKGTGYSILADYVTQLSNPSSSREG